MGEGEGADAVGDPEWDSVALADMEPASFSTMEHPLVTDTANATAKAALVSACLPRRPPLARRTVAGSTAGGVDALRSGLVDCAVRMVWPICSTVLSASTQPRLGDKCLQWTARASRFPYFGSGGTDTRPERSRLRLRALPGWSR